MAFATQITDLQKELILTDYRTVLTDQGKTYGEKPPLHQNIAAQMDLAVNGDFEEKLKNAGTFGHIRRLIEQAVKYGASQGQRTDHLLKNALKPIVESVNKCLPREDKLIVSDVSRDPTVTTKREVKKKYLKTQHVESVEVDSSKYTNSTTPPATPRR